MAIGNKCCTRVREHVTQHMVQEVHLENYLASLIEKGCTSDDDACIEYHPRPNKI